MHLLGRIVERRFLACNSCKYGIYDVKRRSENFKNKSHNLKQISLLLLLLLLLFILYIKNSVITILVSVLLQAVVFYYYFKNKFGRIINKSWSH